MVRSSIRGYPTGTNYLHAARRYTASRIYKSSYYYKDHKWVQEFVSDAARDAYAYAAKSDGIDARAAARPSNHIYTYN